MHIEMLYIFKEKELFWGFRYTVNGIIIYLMVTRSNDWKNKFKLYKNVTRQAIMMVIKKHLVWLQ